MSDDTDNRTHPLLAAGWRQGVLFDAPGVSYGYCLLGDDGRMAARDARTVKPSERLVLISHPCDISGEDEKYLESLICRPYKPDDPILRRWDKNSSSHFVVDPDSAFVAIATHRIKIDKQTIVRLPHHGVKMDEERLERFIQWLARRYNRPVVPDAVYDHFHRLAYVALEETLREQSLMVSAFNAAVHDIRVTLPQKSEPPFQMGLTYLTTPALSAAQLDAIFAIHRIITAATEGTATVGDPEILDRDEVPLGTIRRTQPLIFEHPSFSDDDAAPPLWLLNPD